jgi:hypothetical protein
MVETFACRLPGRSVRNLVYPILAVLLEPSGARLPSAKEYVTIMKAMNRLCAIGNLFFIEDLPLAWAFRGCTKTTMLPLSTALSSSIMK